MTLSTLFPGRAAAWVVFFLVVGVGCEPGYIKDTKRFASRVKSVANPDELRTWATNLIAKTTITASNSVEVKQTDIPQSLRSLYEYPPDAYVEGASDGAPAYVAVWYGSGFGHWGLFIGDPTLVKSRSKTHYVVEWKPGIYFWSGP